MALVHPKDRDKPTIRSWNEHVQSEPSEYLDGDLCRLLLFQSTFGVTYMGKFQRDSRAKSKCSYVEQRRKLKLIALVCYELLSIGLLSAFEYFMLREDVYERIFPHTTKKLTMNFIFRLSTYCYLVEYVTLKTMTMVHGSKIIDLINQISLQTFRDRHSRTVLMNIYLINVVMIALHVSSFVLGGSIFDEGQTLDKKIIFFGTFVVAAVMYSVNKMCLTSLQMFIAMLICAKIKRKFQLEKRKSFKKLTFLTEIQTELPHSRNQGQTLATMVQLKAWLTSLNGYFSYCLLTKTVINGILLASQACAFEDRLHDENYDDSRPMGGLLCLTCTQLIDISASCYSSQMILNQMKSLVAAIQEYTARQALDREDRMMALVNKSNLRGSANLNHSNQSLPRIIDDVEYRCLQTVCTMEGSFCFTVMNMFDLKSITVMIILSNALNYAVILIQTQ